MANFFNLSPAASFFWISLILVAQVTCIRCDTGHGDGGHRKVYIVYMGALPHLNEYFPQSHHTSILQDVLEGSSVQDSLVRHYGKSFNGFAAKLTEKEVEKISSMEDIVSVFPSRVYQIQTTWSWDFMGFPETVKRNPTVESDVIIGVIDTGISPESESFNDEGFGPAPKKWKGVCKGGTNFTCNNKLIGARFYTGDGTARDLDGHGTHTSSTAAGNVVKGASFFGLAEGIARGAVPSARIAMYKACDLDGCSSEDILAAFDDATADGVDILSVSLGFSFIVGLDEDPVAIGSFHAMQNGILTSHSSGNKDSSSKNTTSLAPWIFSVAGSNTDRHLIDKVVLGSGTTLAGVGVNSFNLNGTSFPLLYGKEVTTSCTLENATSCYLGCLDNNLVKGKIVVCDSIDPSGAIYAGALGTILVGDDRIDLPSVHALPASHVSVKDGEKIKSYINSGKNPVANILRTESVKDFQAPVVASFSRVGPNNLIPDILKPDITAPGVGILAAYSPDGVPAAGEADTRSVKYNVLSGTSMACPHVTGAAAYIKTFHPEWSPSAIKSALMTTAWVMNDTKNAEGDFAYGGGHIDPVKAVSPGLVYETDKDDYVKMLCDIGLNASSIKVITNATCPNGAKGTAKDLNYPSMAALVHGGSSSSFQVKFPRTVTNVGVKNSTYKAKITSNGKIKITVSPNVLYFNSLGEKKSFVVSVAGEVSSRVSASLIWSDGDHIVRSPIVVYTG